MYVGGYYVGASVFSVLCVPARGLVSIFPGKTKKECGARGEAWRGATWLSPLPGSYW